MPGKPKTDVEEEKQTLREIKILLLVFVFGIFISVVVQQVYGPKYFKLATLITTLFVYLLVAAMIGRVMWNSYVIELVPLLKRAKGFEYILGLMIFTQLVLRA
jgi:hypothetical protein